MTAKVILNPYAGRWKALRMRGDVELMLKAAGLDYEIVLTEAPGHGTELAAQAVRDGFTPIISAGGDGSISEVVNGMASASQALGLEHPTPLGILPLGSANDLVVNLGMPTDMKAAVDVIIGGKTRLVDLGQVTAWSLDKSSSKQRYFDNNSAIGLEPSVTIIQQRIQYIHGTLRYLVATLLCIAQNPQWTMRLEWDGGEYQGPTTLVTVGNNPLTGGLFYMTPHADPSDGLLTFVYGYIPTRLKILSILPKTMKSGPGNYVEHPAIHEIHGTHLRISSDQPTPVHADGEILFEATQHIEYQVLPLYLPVLVNGKTS
jgi:diacylglycerol kinase (ATP)